MSQTVIWFISITTLLLAGFGFILSVNNKTRQAQKVRIRIDDSK